MELYGRTKITSAVEEINSGNVLDVLAKVMPTHLSNAAEETYLLNYYKGKTKILQKEKTVRPEINHKCHEALPYQIAEFWSGTMVGDPIVYTSRKDDTDSVSKLNDYMTLDGKEAHDKSLFDWLLITGHAYRMVLPGTIEPFNIYELDPRNTFVIYSSKYDGRVLAGITYVKNDKSEEIFSIYTEKELITVKNRVEIMSVERYQLGIIPIFEYFLNDSRLGIYEPVLDLIDSIDSVDSDRLDALTTFVNSLCVIYNAELPDGEDGNTIREKGLITLHGTGENKADIKILSEELNQTSAETLKQDLYNAILRIVGMPSQGDGSGGDSSNNGATFLKSGYQITEMRAKGMELMFKRTERQMLRIVLLILQNTSDVDMDVTDVDVTFTRHAYSDINSKANVLSLLLNNNKVAPIDAWILSNITPDPEECCKRGLEYYDEKQAEEKAAQEEGVAVEETSDI